jgi:hypothetical protein
MIELLRRNPLLAALVVACGVLAVIIAIEIALIGAPATSSTARKVSPPEARLLPPLASVTPDVAYPETAARPLWIPTRRPAPPVVAAAQPAFARGQFILQGVTIAGGTRIAMLKEKSTGRVHRVEQGRDLNGLQVVEVEPDKVTLAQGAEREVVELRVQRLGATPGAPPGAAPGGSGGAGPFGSGPVAGGTPPSPQPGGLPAPVPAGMQAGPAAGPLPPRPAAPGAANPSPTAVPQQQSTAPMTPEELLARRRARRNLSNE